MKKLSVLAFALVMAASGSVLAEQLGADTTVDGVTHRAGSHGTETISDHSFNRTINLNGTDYPAGTRFEVIRLDNGTLVPTRVLPTLAPVPLTSGLSTGMMVGLGGLVAVGLAGGSSPATPTVQH